MIFKVFGRDIEIDNVKLDEYQQKVKNIPTSRHIEFLAFTSGCTKNSTDEELIKGIYEGLEDEIAVIPNALSYSEHLKKQGVFNDYYNKI